MRIISTLMTGAILFTSANTIAAESESYGSFLGINAAFIDTDEIDSVNAATKIVFGPNITKSLSLELGLMDLGEMGYDKPNVVFDDVATNAPTFTNADRGDVERSNGTDTTLSKATYIGPKSFNARGFLINLRYNFALNDNLDLFVKAGGNAWVADITQMEITATGDRVIVSKDGTTRETSGVELISGIGLMWKPWQSVIIRAELESTSLDSIYIEPVDFLMYGLGLQYEF